MQKTGFKAVWALFIIVILLASSVWFTAQKRDQEGPSGRIATPDLRYDYELIYTYRNMAYDAESFAKLAGLLQSKDILTVKAVNYGEDNGILQISYQLKLTAAEPDYTVDFTRQMQDAIVLFAVFDYIEGVVFNFEQADYGFGGVPIMRADAETLFGEQIRPFGLTKEDFVETFPPKVQTVVWERNVMDTVNYYHAMGLDQ